MTYRKQLQRIVHANRLHTNTMGRISDTAGCPGFVPGAPSRVKAKGAAC